MSVVMSFPTLGGAVVEVTAGPDSSTPYSWACSAGHRGDHPYASLPFCRDDAKAHAAVCSVTDEERARLSVNRAFPNVARFLARDPGQLPVYGPTDPFGDEEHEPDVIVRVDFLMSREQITTALGIAWAEGFTDHTPEELTVVEVRHEVEAYLSVQALHALGVQMERDAQRTFPPEQQAVMQLLAAAVERAYPPRRTPEPPIMQRPRYGDGTVTVDTDDRGEITIPEPAWCLGHDDEPIGYRADVTHKGRRIVAEFESDRGPIPFLPARISWAPFSELHPEPFPVADVEDFPAMTPAQLRELAAETARHADRLYRLADDLALLRLGGQS
ncbi:DUF6907 domain-containing protein [Streptomyces sp. NPDC000888]